MIYIFQQLFLKLFRQSASFFTLYILLHFFLVRPPSKKKSKVPPPLSSKYALEFILYYEGPVNETI